MECNIKSAKYNYQISAIKENSPYFSDQIKMILNVQIYNVSVKHFLLRLSLCIFYFKSQFHHIHLIFKLAAITVVI